MPIIVVLIDGVGLAPATAANPVAAGFGGLRTILGAALTDALQIRSARLVACPIDANLDVAGLPQSGSGHATIWGGFNAAALNGRHQPNFPTVAMRERLASDNLLLAAQRDDQRVAWANAYLPGYDHAVAQRKLRHTAGTLAALSCGLALRGVNELIDETAVSWDVTQQMARTRPGATHLPTITAMEAGARLARLAGGYDLVGYETYLPDLAGHERLSLDVPDALTLVDGLLCGAIRALDERTTLVITSDHGNSEDATHRIHTRNPVPLIAVGPAAESYAAVRSIADLRAATIRALTEEQADG